MQSNGEKDCAEFIRRYWSDDDSLPKHEKLRRAVATAITDGYWPLGARLPSESEWVAATPCGLATVQRTFRALVADGLIQRRRGSGTTVSNRNRPLAEPWHMRFLRHDTDTEYLSISTRVLSRRVVRNTGPWSEVLGQGDHPMVKITRLMHIANEFDVYNLFYARADRFPELVSESLQSLNGTNIKRFISQRHRISIHHVRHRLRFEPTPKWVTEHASQPVGPSSVVINAVAQLPDGDGVYYQDFYLPPNDLVLELGTQGL